MKSVGKQIPLKIESSGIFARVFFMKELLRLALINLFYFYPDKNI